MPPLRTECTSLAPRPVALTIAQDFATMISPTGRSPTRFLPRPHEHHVLLPPVWQDLYDIRRHGRQGGPVQAVRRGDDHPPPFSPGARRRLRPGRARPRPLDPAAGPAVRQAGSAGLGPAAAGPGRRGRQGVEAGADHPARRGRDRPAVLLPDEPGEPAAEPAAAGRPGAVPRARDQSKRADRDPATA